MHCMHVMQWVHHRQCQKNDKIIMNCRHACYNAKFALQTRQSVHSVDFLIHMERHQQVVSKLPASNHAGLTHRPSKRCT
jgi:hypothetical protein